jgi:hypothetical protein
MKVSYFNRQTYLLGLLFLFLSLASCGPVPQAGGGIGGTGSVATVSSGPVTKFGSVYVSGTKYDNSNTTYCIDDDPCSSENKLKLGMVVLVNGRTVEKYSNNQSLVHIADTITYEETVEGDVQSIAADGLSVTVLGQVIHVDQKTIIDSSIAGQSLTSLVPGTDRIEVSGFVVGDGHILATLIMRQAGTLHYEVQGTIKNHDSGAKSFEIGALRIDYSTADIGRIPLPGNTTWNGLVVWIRGDQWSQGGAGPSGGTVVASRISLLGFGVEESHEAELEGVILQVNGPGDFVVNNLRIQTTPTTVFEGGTIGDLIADAHVIIHGRLVGGILQAEQISLEGEFELEANVLTIDSGTSSLTLAGLPGMTVFIDDHTAIDGEGDLRTLGSINIGDHLHIHGRAASGGLLATELERSDPSTAVHIQGPVRSVSEPILSIGGATIDTRGIPDSRFIGKDGTAIGRSTFFRDLAVGQNVALSGTWTGTGIIWTSARLKT